MKLLPTQGQWVQEVCEHLIDGEVIIVRGVPGSGKTTLLNAVARELGDSSLPARGRSFTEQNQDERAEDLQNRVHGALDRHGSAHVLFDDYPHALQRTHGLRLQRQLLHLLVDGEYALDIGAVLTGRWARSMHLISRGSPLVARARVMPLPCAGEADFAAVGLTQIEASARSVGGNTALLAKVATVLGKPALHQVHETAATLAPKWIQDVPWEAVRWIKAVVNNGPAILPSDDSATEALAPLVFPTGDGCYDVVGALREGAARIALDGRAPTWPDRWAESVATFCGFLAGVPKAVWVDRYLATDPPRLLQFIRAVRAANGTSLQILIAKDQAGRIDAPTVASFAALDCAIRAMHPGDRKQLHDRQLVFLGGIEGGVIMPTGRVVLCQDPPGSAAAVRAASLDQKLILDAWQRGQAPA
ncbi:ATP-binding protein [Kitasatospora aureofaciens]|uniref:ATP-binding protein n=1 Tax=Kitasatospora aureofaciens TaxID=1894 RepID=UPI0037C795A1